MGGGFKSWLFPYDILLGFFSNFQTGVRLDFDWCLSLDVTENTIF